MVGLGLVVALGGIETEMAENVTLLKQKLQPALHFVFFCALEELIACDQEVTSELELSCPEVPYLLLS